MYHISVIKMTFMHFSTNLIRKRNYFWEKISKFSTKENRFNPSSRACTVKLLQNKYRGCPEKYLKKKYRIFVFVVKIPKYKEKQQHKNAK